MYWRCNGKESHGSVCVLVLTLHLVHFWDKKRKCECTKKLGQQWTGVDLRPECFRFNSTNWSALGAEWPPAGHWCEWPKNRKQTSWGWPEGTMSCSWPCAHRPAPWSSTGICKRTPEVATPPLVPCIFHRWKQVSLWAPVIVVKESREDKENAILLATLFSLTGLVVGQWWSGESYPWRDAQTSTG